MCWTRFHFVFRSLSRYLIFNAGYGAHQPPSSILSLMPARMKKRSQDENTISDRCALVSSIINSHYIFYELRVRPRVASASHLNTNNDFLRARIFECDASEKRSGKQCAFNWQSLIRGKNDSAGDNLQSAEQDSLTLKWH